MITDGQMQEALDYLQATDEKCAYLKVEVARKDYVCKRVRAKVFLLAEGNNEVRKAKAETDTETEKVEDERAEAIIEYEKVKAKRETSGLIVEVWRSMNANRRQGSFT